MGRVKKTAAPASSGPRFGPAGSRAPKKSELRPHVHGATMRKAVRLGVSVIAVVAVAAPLYWSISSGWLRAEYAAAHQAFLDYTARSGLALQEVKVQGRGETAIADILTAIHANRGDPILGIDIDAVRERLEDLPWIVKAGVERQFPDQLIVSVTEAEPMALWQRNQKLFLVSRDGDVIETANIAKYSNLLIVVGEDAPKQAQTLFDILAQTPDLRPHVTAAVLVGKRRWNIRMDNDVDVKLPEDGAAAAWKRFADLNRQNDLLSKDITVVDMRQSDRVVVRQAHPTLPTGANQPSGASQEPKGNDT
ncbi:MAG TPA: cell division protein FtsQ/DivIB [Dongiaceae bacterium]|jgi:cell division protein FtsQ|nr:cell division protein FtsQ/DivIB [Dongiaceae bacterium]